MISYTGRALKGYYVYNGVSITVKFEAAMKAYDVFNLGFTLQYCLIYIT